MDRGRRGDERKIEKMSEFNLLLMSSDTPILLNFKDSRSNGSNCCLHNICRNNIRMI